jgi:hypothetical protein
MLNVRLKFVIGQPPSPPPKKSRLQLLAHVLSLPCLTVCTPPIPSINVFHLAISCTDQGGSSVHQSLRTDLTSCNYEVSTERN